MKIYRKLFFFISIIFLFSYSTSNLYLVNNRSLLSSTSSSSTVSNNLNAKNSSYLFPYVKKIDIDTMDSWIRQQYYGVFDFEKNNASIRVYDNGMIKQKNLWNQYGGLKGQYGINYDYSWLNIWVDSGKTKIYAGRGAEYTNTTLSNIRSKGMGNSIGFDYFKNQYANSDFSNSYSFNGLQGIDGKYGTLIPTSIKNEIDRLTCEGVFVLKTLSYNTEASPYYQWANFNICFSDKHRDVSNTNFQYITKNVNWYGKDQNMFYSEAGRDKNWVERRYDKWKGLIFVLGLYDNKFWFVTDANKSKSSIQFNYKKERGDKILLNQFLNIDSDELHNYFDVTLKNTPSNCYTSDPENFKITLTNDPRNRKVIATLTVPRSFVPSTGINSNNKPIREQWISDQDMEQVIELPYDDYFLVPTNKFDTTLNINEFVDNGEYYTFDVTNLGYIPSLDYNSVDAIKNDLLEAILGSWSSILWTSLPSLLTINDGSVNINEENSSYVNGEVIIDELVLIKYYEYSLLITDIPKTFINSDKPLKLTGLNRLPTEVNTTDTTLGLSVQDNVIVWDASNSGIFSDYTNTLPSSFDTSVINAQFLKDNHILINLPSEFDNATYSFVDKQANDTDGTLIFKFTLNNFNNQYGSLQTEAKTFTIKFTGLKSTSNTTWNTNFLSNNTYTYALSPYDKLQGNIFSHITKEITENAINDNIKFYLPTIKDGETLVVDSIELNQPDGAVTVNAHLQKDGVTDITLPPLTITNFVFAPITPKTDTITSDLFPAEFLWSIANSYNEDYSNAVENDQATIIEKLSTLYDGLDASKYDVSIDINKCNASNLSGLLSLQLNVQYKESNAKINLVNSFTLSKTGVSQLAKTYYVDESRTSQELFDYLNDEENANSFFADTTNGIVDTNSIPTLGDINYTISDLSITNKVITANVYVKNGVSANGYIPSFTTDNGYLLGTVTLVGNDYTSNLNSTVISQSNNYLTNDLFANVQTPSKFKEVVDANKNDQDFLKLLVNVINPTSDTQISISGGEIIDNTITYTFSVSPVIDVNGEISPTPLTGTYIYTLPHGDNVTIVHSLIDLQATKYAFEYTPEELLALNVVEGLPEGVSASISIDEANNFTRTITATLTAASYYNEQGEVTENLRQVITFINAKKVNGPTEVQRNNQPVTESIDALKTALDNKNKDIIQKYITITDTGYTTPVTWEIASYVEVEGELGVFDVTINLTNYYFKNDNTLSFVKNETPTSFHVVLGVISSNPTIIKPTIVANGIAADGDLARITVDDLINIANEVTSKELIQTWMYDHFDRIFDNYPLPVNQFDKNVITINIISAGEEENSITVDFNLKDALLPSGEIGPFVGQIVITNLQAKQLESQLKSDQLDITTLNISGITSETYAVDIYHGDAADNALVQAIVNNINENPNNYYVDGTAPSTSEINDRPIINPDVPLTITPNEDGSTITINLEFLKRGENPNVPAVYAPGTITLGTFNTSLTASTNSPIAVSGDLATKLPSHVENDDIIDLLKQESTLATAFSNYPQLFLTTNATDLVIVGKEANDASGQLTATVNVSNAYIGTSAPNNVNGIGNATFDIILCGFTFNIQQTTGKHLTVNQAASAGLIGISSQDYSFDFEEQYGLALTSLLNDVTYLHQWLNNPPPIEQIKNIPIIDGELTFSSSKDNNNKPIVLITGNFISYNASGNTNDPLQYLPQTITISGFNTKNTTTSSVDINDLINNLVGQYQYSLSTIVDKLNGELKDEVKTILSQVLINKVDGKVYNFDNNLIEEINNGNFSFSLNGQNILCTVENIKIAIDHGTAYEQDMSLNFSIINSNNIFNNNDLNTYVNQKIIKYDSKEFVNIFGSDISLFYYDWKVAMSDESFITARCEALKNYINQNLAIKKTYININTNSNINNYYNNINITSLMLNDYGNDQFSVDLTYTGYINGDLTRDIQANDKIIIQLKPTPKSSLINNIIQQYINIADDSYLLAKEEERQQIIESLTSSINKHLSKILPNAVTSVNGDRNFVSSNDFVYDEQNNTICLPKDSIIIQGPIEIENGKEVIKLPFDDFIIRSRPFSKNNHYAFWVLIALFLIWIIAMIISIIIHEERSKKKMRETHDKLKNKQY